MKKLKKFIGYFWLFCFLSGILAIIIAQSGKGYLYLSKDSTTMDQINTKFGEPIWETIYYPDTKIKLTKEYLLYESNKKFGPFIWGTNDNWESKPKPKEREVRFVKVYAFNGRLWRSERAQGLGMIHALSFGFGGVLFLPGEIIEYVETLKETNYITYWFDKNGHYIGVFTGDIKNQIENGW